MRLFADDSAIYRSIDTKEDSHALQKDLFLLQNWAHKWQMNFNVKKCKSLCITKRTTRKISNTYVMGTDSPPQEPIIVPISIQKLATETLLQQNDPRNLSPLEEIESDKYLGIHLDTDLSFNTHIEQVCNKSSKLLNLCRRNLNMCHKSTKELAYKAIVRPHLEYSSAAWSPHTAKNINKLEMVQRRAARFVLNDYDYSPLSDLSSKIKHTLKWMPLQHRRALSDLFIFFKIRNALINIPFPAVTQASPNHSLRYLHVQALHSEAFRYHFFIRTIRIWNLLPPKIAGSTNPESFKSQAQQWITPMEWTRTNGTWTLA